MEWSQKQFGEFLDALPDAAIVVDEGGLIVLGNSRAARLFGVRPDELAFAPLATLFAADSPPDIRRLLSATPVGAGGAPQPDSAGAEAAGDWTLLRRGRGSFAAQISCGRVSLERREFVLAVVRDVGDRRREEAELRKSEERLRQAVRVSEIGIFDHDHATDAHYWSARQRQLYGWPEGEPVNIPSFLERLHPDDREVIGVGIRRAHDPAGDGAFDVEHRILRSDGQVRWIATRSKTLFEGEGAARRAVRTVGACVDFTDRKSAEEGRERLAAILDGTPDFVSIADPAGNLLYLNRAARTLVGLGPTDDVSRIRVADNRPAWASELVLRTALPTAMRDGFWQGETAFLDREGHEVPVSQVLLAHRRPGGPIDFLSTVARDLTKEKGLEAQVRQAQKMEAVGRLAGGVAHDFNNLLSVILGSATLAASGLPAGHPSREDIEEIKVAADRAAELTRGMLAFSRKQVLRPRVLDVNDVLQRMMPMTRRLIGEHLELDTRLAPDVGRIKVDANHLEQVVLNLVVNARDAMSQGGKLTIETANALFAPGDPRPRRANGHGPGIVITVSDTGVGMDAATKARLFEPFFTTKAPGQGTGLGLSIVFGIVKQSGGEIVVESEVGRGTSVSLYFPQTEETLPLETPASAPVTPTGAGGLVLLVEDEAQLRKLLAMVLTRAGYDVLVAEGPLEALAVAQREWRRIDLLLSDVVMPHMSGKDLADRITVARPDTRVLLISGYAGPSVLSEEVLGWGVHFLPKPFSPEVLLATVDRILREKGRGAP